MFFDEDDDIFGGTPKSKFFDIVFNANANLVRFELEKMVERYVAMESLLESQDENFEQKVQSHIMDNQDEVESLKNDFFMGFVGDVLSNNE